MRIRIAVSYETMSREAAAIIIAEVKRKPGLLLCVSAGGTPTLTYQLLAAAAARDPRWFRKLRVLQIDEWVGLPSGHPGTCAADLRRKVLEPLQISPDRAMCFRTEAADPKAECRRVASWLGSHGPIDVCILGLGHNGHVAMNEPGAAITPQVHVARLAASSRKHPLLKDLAKKPTHGLTLGMCDIFQSKRILLLVNGRLKRQAVRQLIQPRITTRFPASLLSLHPGATLLCDREAAADSSAI
jgi:galactosamine-6-phosphate isomerase